MIAGFIVRYTSKICYIYRQSMPKLSWNINNYYGNIAISTLMRRRPNRWITFSTRDLCRNGTNFVIAKRLSSQSLSDSTVRTNKEKAGESHEHVKQTTIILSRHDIENFFRSHGNAAFKLTFGLVFFICLTVYIFREYIRENMADEVADVASRSLSDVQVVNQANIVSKTVVQDILNDERTQNAATDFIIQLTEKEETRIAMLQLVKTVLNDPETLEQLTILSKKLLDQLIHDEETMNKLLVYLRLLIADSSTQVALQNVANNVLQSRQTKNYAAQGLKEVIASDVISNQSIELGKHVCQEVVADKSVQTHVSEAAWSLFKRSLYFW